MKFNAVTRGAGKVFLHLETVAAEADVRCRSTLRTGQEIPVAVLTDGLPRNRAIAVVPQLSVAQTVEVDVVDRDGQVIDSASHKVNPLVAAVESRMSRVLHEGAACGSDVDLQMHPDEAWVHVSRIVADDGHQGQDVVRFAIKSLARTSRAASSSFNVRAFDARGRSIALEDCVVLEDSADRVNDYDEIMVRRLSLSVRKEQSVRFFLSVTFEEGLLPGGFVYVDAYYDARIRWCSWGPFNRGAGSSRYHDWFVEHHRASKAVLAIQREARFPIEPIFSIIVPIYKTPVEYFREMVDSVLAQTYGKFELLLMNASPEDEELCGVVEEYRRRDGRIRACDLAENGGIVLNTNAGIREARGDFLCFLDHDDVIEPDLLFEYAQGINKYPTTDLLYCDEDLLRGGRFADGSPKPDYDRTLILAYNMVTHMLAVRKSIVDSFDGLPGREYEGSQDHNLTLRVAELARNVYHVRKIRYHWRVHPGSTAADMDAKPYAVESGRLAVREHLDRVGVAASVEHFPGFPNVYAVNYKLPEPMPLVSMVIAADREAMLERLLCSISANTCYEHVEVLVAWRGGGGEFESICSRVGNGAVRRMVWNGDESVHAAFNRAAREAQGSLLLFLGQEVEPIDPQWVNLLAGPLYREGNAACGPRLLYPDGLVRQMGVVLSKSGPVRMSQYVPRDSQSFYTFTRFAREVTAVEANCLMVSRKVFDEVGGFDEAYFTELGSLDFCLRLGERGYSVIAEPRAELFFRGCDGEGEDLGFGGVPSNAGEQERARALADTGRLDCRWAQVLAATDPHYGDEFGPGPRSFEYAYPPDSMNPSLD